MDMNLKAFMKEELKDRGTMEFKGIDKFKDKDGNPIPFIIKCLSMKEVKEIRNSYRTTKVYRENGGNPIVLANGQVAVMKEYDSESAGLELMVEAFVQPKLDAPELMEYYGVLDRLDMPRIIFADNKDYMYADDCLQIALGLKEKEKTEKEVIEDLKN